MTELMKRYEAETGKNAIEPCAFECYGGVLEERATDAYVAWLESKIIDSKAQAWQPTGVTPSFEVLPEGVDTQEYAQVENLSSYFETADVPPPYAGMGLIGIPIPSKEEILAKVDECVLRTLYKLMIREEQRDDSARH